jgi:uncharacterized protein YneF (UPF0154 family)
MDKWMAAHPRISAIGGAIVFVVGLLSAIQLFWSLFRSEPLIPYISNSIPILAKIVIIVISIALTSLGFWILIKIFLATSKDNPSWLRQSLKDDLKNSAKRLHSRSYYLDFKGFDKPDSYFELTLHAINAAVYPIYIDGIDGAFLVNAQKCVHATEISKTRIPHGEVAGIVFRQYITSEMKNFIIEYAKSQGTINVGIDNCRIIIKREVEGYEAPVKVGSHQVAGQPTIQVWVREILESYIVGSQT